MKTENIINRRPETAAVMSCWAALIFSGSPEEVMI